jgi:hypothetical protein
LNFTVLDPCVDRKLDPEMVIDSPTAPDAALRPLIDGGGITMNATPLLVALPRLITGPLAAVAGTVAVIDVGDQLVTVAATPLNRVPSPGLLPKFVPVICTGAFTGADVGETLDTDGGGGSG